MMKNLKQKIFISLILGFGLFIGCSFATTTPIDVSNWNPRGVLMLNKLILKKGNGVTGIVLNGTGAYSYIELAKWNSSVTSGIQLIGSGSQINVNKICDANGNNCAVVSQLSGGGDYWTLNGSNLSTNGNYGIDTTAPNDKSFKFTIIDPDQAGSNQNSQIVIDSNGIHVKKGGLTVAGGLTVTGNIKVPASNGKIQVKQICTQDNTKCYNVSDLSTGGGGGGGGGYWKKNGNNLETSGADYGLTLKKKLTITSNGLEATGQIKLNGQTTISNANGEYYSLVVNSENNEQVRLDKDGFRVDNTREYIRTGKLRLVNSDIEITGGSNKGITINNGNLKLNSGNLIVTGSMRVAKDANFKSGITVDKKATFNDGLTVKQVVNGVNKTLLSLDKTGRTINGTLIETSKIAMQGSQIAITSDASPVTINGKLLIKGTDSYNYPRPDSTSSNIRRADNSSEISQIRLHPSSLMGSDKDINDYIDCNPSTEGTIVYYIVDDQDLGARKREGRFGGCGCKRRWDTGEAVCSWHDLEWRS